MYLNFVSTYQLVILCSFLMNNSVSFIFLSISSSLFLIYSCGVMSLSNLQLSDFNCWLKSACLKTFVSTFTLTNSYEAYKDLILFSKQFIFSYNSSISLTFRTVEFEIIDFVGETISLWSKLKLKFVCEVLNN